MMLRYNQPCREVGGVCCFNAESVATRLYGNKGFIIAVSWSFSSRNPSCPNFDVIS